VFVLVQVSVCLAGTDTVLGTAGKFRSLKVENCGKPFAAQKEGACDPAPVSDALTATEKIVAHLARAERLVSLMRFQQARQAVDEALTLDPESVSALKFSTRLALFMGDNDTAWRHINAAIKIKPDDSDLLATRAEMHWGHQETVIALQDAAMAIRLNPKNTDAFRIRGRIFMVAGQLDQALTDWNAALALEPDFDLVRLFRAQTNLRLGNFNAAIDDASIILAQKPRDISALEVRAFAYGAEGKLDQAVEDLDGLLDERAGGAARDRMLRPMLLQRMILLFRLDREDEGRRDMEALLSGGGTSGVLQMQLFLRKNGYPDVQIDGRRSERLEHAILACTSNPSCLQALSQRI